MNRPFLIILTLAVIGSQLSFHIRSAHGQVNGSIIEKALDQFEKEKGLAREALPQTVTDQPEGGISPRPKSPTLAARGEIPPEEIMLDSLELKDMDIGDVLKVISQKSGLNIVAGQNVTAKVTIYLKDVNVREALRIILESNGLAYADEDNIIRVMTAADFAAKYGHNFGEKIQTRTVPLTYAKASDIVLVLNHLKSNMGQVIADDHSNTLILMDVPDKLDSLESLVKEIDAPVTTKVFNLNYSIAEDIANKITEVLTSNLGRIKFDARSNKIVVTDTVPKVNEIEKIIKAFDVKESEVLIEAKIVQIVLSDEYKLGVDWEAIVSDFHSLKLNGDLSALNAVDPGGKLSVGTISGDDYNVLLEALETVGKTNILSSPRITAMNNKEAKILVGSTEPYVTTTTTTPSTGPATTAESVNFIEVGVKLYVTPTIHNDDFITMKIRPEVSSVVRTLTTSNNNSIPVVETSEAETTVMVKNNVSIVIGGLIKEEKINSIKKIPLLGDLPLVGFAFRNEGKQSRKTEIVIFLTPRIISGDHPADINAVSLTEP